MKLNVLILIIICFFTEAIKGKNKKFKNKNDFSEFFKKVEKIAILRNEAIKETKKYLDEKKKIHNSINEVELANKMLKDSLSKEAAYTVEILKMIEDEALKRKFDKGLNLSLEINIIFKIKFFPIKR